MTIELATRLKYDGEDCSQEESAEIKMWFVNHPDFTDPAVQRVAHAFPLEWDEVNERTE